MLVLKIDPGGTLGQRAMAIISAKLRNADEMSMVPIKVEADAVKMGCDWSEFNNDWEFTHRRVSQQLCNRDKLTPALLWRQLQP